jgi:hypothetical protein
MKGMGKKGFYTREKENINIKERFATLHGKEKWMYFKTYYLLKTLLLFATIIILISIVVSQIQVQNDIPIHIAVVEDELQEDLVDETLLNMKIGVGGVDAVIAEKPFFDEYPTEYYVDLEEVLTKEKKQEMIGMLSNGFNIEIITRLIEFL